MAPLPANSTARFFLDYVAGQHYSAPEHTMAIRTESDVTAAEAGSWFLDLLTAITPAKLWTGWRVVRLRYQPTAASFSVPVSLPAALGTFVGTANADYVNDMTDAIEYTFQGRSYTTGRRVDFSLYGLNLPSIAKPRYLPNDAQFPWLSGVLSGLNGETSLPICIDGTKPTWYSYLNANYNSYWESRARR